MFFLRKQSATKLAAKEEFKRLWNDELLKNVDSRDFSKVYNYAMRKRSIRDMALKLYFDFNSEDSLRYKEACDAFDEGDILWTFMLIKQFSSLPGYATYIKHITNKRRAFLSDKRKDSIISRQTARRYMHDLVQNNVKQGEEFIESALKDFELYNNLKKEGKYKSAYKVIALTDKTSEYTVNIKKYLYYAVKRPITPENEQQTLSYFDYVGKYYNFKRKLYGGGYITILDIDVLMAMIAFMRNGGTIDSEFLAKNLHRTVKVYCKETMFASVCVLADYLYQIGEIEMEQDVLKLLVHYGEAVDEKYKKRYTCLELMSKNSNNFIFRHKSRAPLECVVYDNNSDGDIAAFLETCNETKQKNNWCIVLKREVKTYLLNYKLYYDDRLLSTLEDILDAEFGNYVLEYALHTYFTGDQISYRTRSMLIVTSGKNKFADFPKIGIMVKVEPITKKYVNVQYCLIYLPEESYTKEEIKADSDYILSVLNGTTDSRFETYTTVVKDLIWRTVDKMLNTNKSN